MPYSYAYLVLCLLLGIVWLSLYLLRKDLRRRQLFVSLFTAPVAITQVLWFYHDYWRPQYLWEMNIYGVSFGAENVLFCFFIGGIGAVLYEVVFQQKYRSGRARYWETLGLIVATIFLYILFHAAGIVSIVASSLSLVTTSLVMIAIDKNLRTDWFLNAICMFVLITMMYLIWFALYPGLVEKFWVSSALSGIQPFGIPVEELTWYVSWAMFSGIAYGFMANAGKYSIGKNT